MSNKREGGVNAILAKLEKNINDGDYYQALQLYRSLYQRFKNNFMQTKLNLFRYTAKKRYQVLREMLTDGAVLMLHKRQVNAGTELAMFLIEHYNKANVPVTKEFTGTSKGRPKISKI